MAWRPRDRSWSGWGSRDSAAVADRGRAVYTYIMMRRTQIYLEDEQDKELTRLAHERGRTKSALIRDAIRQSYPRRLSTEERLKILEETAGAWKDREEDGEAYVERIRTGKRWQLLYPEEYPALDDETSGR